MRPQLFRSIASNYVAVLVALLASLVLTPFILMRLGAATYGLWVLVGSVVGYGSLLDLSISAAIVKYVAEHRARDEHTAARELIATALAAHLVLGAFVALFAVAAAPVIASVVHVGPELRPTAERLAMLMGVGIGLSIPCSAPTAVLRGLHRFDLAAALAIAGTLIRSAATVVVLVAGGGVLGLVAVNLALLVLLQVPAVWLIRRVAPELRFGVRAARASRLRQVLSFSSSLFVMNAASHLEQKTDEVVIGVLMPIEAVTPYALAHRLAGLPQMVADQFMKVLPPLASALDAGAERERMLRLYLDATRLTLAALLCLAGPLVLLAAPILTLWVGAAYADYAYLVAILTIASVIDTSQWPGGSVAQGMARHRPLMWLSVGAGIANLVLSIALGRAFGLAGVALGTLIPTTVACFAFVQPYLMRVVGARAPAMLREVYRPALLPVAPMLLVLYGLRTVCAPSSLASVALVGALGALTYVGVYLGLAAPATDRRIAAAIVGSVFARSGPPAERLSMQDPR